MKGHIQRYVCQLMRVGIRERHRPGQTTFLTPAAACSKAAETSNRMPDRDAGRKDVGGYEAWQVLHAHVEYSSENSEQETALIHSGCLQSTERKDVRRVTGIELPVEQKHEQL